MLKYKFVAILGGFVSHILLQLFILVDWFGGLAT